MKNNNSNSTVKVLSLCCVVLSVILVVMLGLIIAGTERNTDTPFVSDTTTTNSTTESTTETTTQSTTESTTTEPVTVSQSDGIYTEKQETVYATTTVNVRKGPGTSYEKVGSLSEGSNITRIATGTNGWSKVIFGGETCYVSSEYLSTEKPTETTEATPVSSNRIIINPNQEQWNLVVVNMSREMPEGYSPTLGEIADTGVYMDYRVAPHYTEMYYAAKKDGIILTPYSGYRSYDRQKNNYNNLTNEYMSTYGLSREDAAKKAATVILPPGTSEHNLGLAMDICNTLDSFATQKEYKWLTEHAHEYGFILRYTGDKMSITGIVSEPWHWRYVGVEHAKKIKDSGLCLEEYLDSIGVAY